MHRLMSNRKLTLKEKYDGELLLPQPALSPLRRPLSAISSNGCLECTRDRHLRHHLRLIAAVEQHDEPPTRIITAVYVVSSASDRTTLFVL